MERKAMAHEVKVNLHLASWYLKPIVEKNKVSPDGSVEIKKAIKFLFFTYTNIKFYPVQVKQPSKKENTPFLSPKESKKK